VRVLDASAFVHDYTTEDQTASVPEVAEELTGETAYQFDALTGAGMRVHVPADEAVVRVRRAAGDTGDDGVLSRTDRRLLAAALELDAVLVTDDYAVQNVAEKLDLETEVIARDGIAERRDWRFQCQGCGREFDDDEGRCPICGSELTRKNPN
jgi:UPF0271 protein